jgi:large subunit ribosomal protein L22
MPETTQYMARHRFARLTARKARLIADAIRGQSVNQALETLSFAPQRAAAFYLKVLKSAVANATLDENVDVNRLFVSDSRADDGPLHNNRRRFRAGPQGRAMPFVKRTAHLTICVAEATEEEQAGSRTKNKKGTEA